MREEDTFADDDHTPYSGDDDGDVAGQSFREHAAKLREKRREKGVAEGSTSSFSDGDGPGKSGFGSPLASVRSSGPSGPGSRGEREGVGSDELVHELRQLRDELCEQPCALDRIADALEDT